MLAVAAESPVGAVIESSFYRSVDVENLANLPVGALRQPHLFAPAFYATFLPAT